MSEKEKDIKQVLEMKCKTDRACLSNKFLRLTQNVWLLSTMCNMYCAQRADYEKLNKISFRVYKIFGVWDEIYKDAWVGRKTQTSNFSF